MPSKSEKQARLMRAVAHGWKPTRIKGPTKAVAQEFVRADQRKAKGGPLKQLARRKSLMDGILEKLSDGPLEIAEGLEYLLNQVEQGVPLKTHEQAALSQFLREFGDDLGEEPQRIQDNLLDWRRSQRTYHAKGGSVRRPGRAGWSREDLIELIEARLDEIGSQQRLGSGTGGAPPRNPLDEIKEGISNPETPDEELRVIARRLRDRIRTYRHKTKKQMAQGGLAQLGDVYSLGKRDGLGPLAPRKPSRYGPQRPPSMTRRGALRLFGR